MLSKIILKFSLFAAFLTFIYCVLMDVSISESLLRGLIVFAGYYVILIAFFIALRIFFRPKSNSQESVEQVVEAETIGVEGE